MKHLLLFLALCSAGTAAWAQESPEAITPEQVRQYQEKRTASCTEDASQPGSDPEKGAQWCRCLASQLADHVSMPEWQAAAFHARKHHVREETKILQPYLRRAANVCRLPGS